MDLKAAFDKTEKRWKRMKEKGIRIRLMERIKEIYTKNAVRVQGKMLAWFWTAKRVRQGYPLSLNLFSILVADIQEEPKKGRISGVQVEKERIWSLAYADDLVLLAKNKERMKEIIKRMREKRYL